MTKRTLLMMAVLLLFGFGSASAFPLFQGTPENPGTKFEDNDYDYFLDLSAVGTPGYGIIDAGDVLYAAIEFDYVIDNVGGSPTYDLSDAQDELVAWSTIQVQSITGTGVGQTWTFQQYGDIPMVQVYSGGAPNLDLLTGDPTLAEAEAAVKDNAVHLWDFSITDDLDTYWQFVLTLPVDATDPNDVRGVSSGTNIGALNYQLNQVWGNDIFTPIVGLNLGGDGLVDLIGSGTIQGGQNLTYAFARSDIDATVNPIPEPSTMILLGAGLLGLAAMRRKSRKQL